MKKLKLMKMYHSPWIKIFAFVKFRLKRNTYLEIFQDISLYIQHHNILLCKVDYNLDLPILWSRHRLQCLHRRNYCSCSYIQSDILLHKAQEDIESRIEFLFIVNIKLSPSFTFYPLWNFYQFCFLLILLVININLQ